VTDDAILFLSETGTTFRTPNWLLPRFHNHGNYIVSLGNVVRWLGEQAEAPGRGDLPRLCRRRSALQRRRFRQGRGHRQHGRGQGRRAHR
jgi:flavin-dependent dehydrogenase